MKELLLNLWKWIKKNWYDVLFLLLGFTVFILSTKLVKILIIIITILGLVKAIQDKYTITKNEKDNKIS